MYLDDHLDVTPWTTTNHDETVIDTIDAYVGNQDSQLVPPSRDGDNWHVETNVRALILPNDMATHARVYKWRGKPYHQVGEPIVRSVHGEEHHYTINLEAGYTA